MLFQFQPGRPPKSDVSIARNAAVGLLGFHCAIWSVITSRWKSIVSNEAGRLVRSQVSVAWPNGVFFSG